MSRFFCALNAKVCKRSCRWQVLCNLSGDYFVCFGLGSAEESERNSSIIFSMSVFFI